MIFAACEPIVDEEVLTNTTTADNVELVATQSTAGGNEITLEMQTPGITGYWDYSFGKGYSDRITFAFPLTGTFEFKYIGTLGAEFFEKTVSVTIDGLDAPVAPEWAAILGDDPFAGKNWVYDTAAWAWWAMTPPNDPNAWGSVWWDAGGCCAPADAATGKMHFFYDNAEGIKYSYYDSATATPMTSSFNLVPAADGGFGSLAITGGENILGGYGAQGTSSAEYTIISLTADEMILYCNLTDSGDSGWRYIFKAE